MTPPVKNSSVWPHNIILSAFWLDRWNCMFFILGDLMADDVTQKSVMQAKRYSRSSL